MSCINVQIKMIGDYPIIKLHKLNNFYIEIEKIDTFLNSNVLDISDRLRVSTKLIVNKQLSISCGIVCTAKEFTYLKVSPEKIQWITPDMGVVYNVMSNTDWNIE